MDCQVKSCIACIFSDLKETCSITKENAMNRNVFDIEYEIYFSRETGFFLFKILNSIFNIKPMNILYSFKSSLIFNFNASSSKERLYSVRSLSIKYELCQKIHILETKIKQIECVHLYS